MFSSELGPSLRDIVPSFIYHGTAFSFSCSSHHHVPTSI